MNKYLYLRRENKERKKLLKTIALQFICEIDCFIIENIIYNNTVSIS